MLYALMGVGLSLILGLLNIPNFAHGVLYALGAYVMISGAKAFGFLGGLLAAIVAVAMLGAAIEYFGVRRLYRVHPDYILLLSFGLSLILTESIILVWGPVGITFQPPALLAGAVDLGVTAYPKYRLAVMVVTAALVLGCYLFVTRTRYGAILRAGIEDKEMAAALGINIRRVFTLTFAAGTGRARRGAHDPGARIAAHDGHRHPAVRVRRRGAGGTRQPAGRDSRRPARGRRPVAHDRHLGAGCRRLGLRADDARDHRASSADRKSTR